MKKRFAIQFITVIQNTFLGFTTKDEGYSVKKMSFAFVIINMMIFTWSKTDINTFSTVLTIWLGFAGSLIVVGAVEKNISAVNETKQLNNLKPKEDAATVQE